eukprot:m.400363 g.400363  ORF g.400363 m.400363 type:complete len:731 (-) comp28386_c0_seq25:115-2307(-)
MPASPPEHRGQGQGRRGPQNNYVSTATAAGYLDVAGERPTVQTDQSRQGQTEGFPEYDMMEDRPGRTEPSGVYATATPHAQNSEYQTLTPSYRTVPRPSTVNPVFSISRTEQGTSDTDDSSYSRFGAHSHSAATAQEPVRIVRNDVDASPTKKEANPRRVPLLWKVGVAVALVLAIAALVVGLTTSSQGTGASAGTAAPTSPSVAQASAVSSQQARDVAELMINMNLLRATQAELVANMTRLSASATINSASDVASQATQAELVTNVSRLAATQAAGDATQTHLVANLTRLSATVTGQAALITAVTRQAASRAVQDAAIANVTRLSDTVARLATSVSALAALVPTSDPTRAPTPEPTFSPTVPGTAPVSRPPTLNPTRHPLSAPTTAAPTGPTSGPSLPPTFPPTVVTVGDVLVSQLHHPMALCAVGASSGCQVLDAAAEASIIELNGSVLFSYSVQTTLAGRFPNLRVIRGSLTFSQNALLNSTGNGFASLQMVTGALSISNGGPGSGSFFPALERVGSIRIARGRVTSFVDAFPSLVEIGQPGTHPSSTVLQLYQLQSSRYCTSANNCVVGPFNVSRAFQSLRRVAGSLFITEGHTSGIIDSFTALHTANAITMQRVGPTMTNSFTALQTAGALLISSTSLTTLGGSFRAVRNLTSLTVTTNSNLIGLNSSLAAVARITGTVTIFGNNVNGYFNFSGALPSLGCVGGVHFQTPSLIQVPPRVASLPAC